MVNFDIKKKILDDMLAKNQITQDQFIDKVAELMQEDVEAAAAPATTAAMVQITARIDFFFPRAAQRTARIGDRIQDSAAL